MLIRWIPALPKQKYLRFGRMLQSCGRYASMAESALVEAESCRSQWRTSGQASQGARHYDLACMSIALIRPWALPMAGSFFSQILGRAASGGISISSRVSTGVGRQLSRLPCNHEKDPSTDDTPGCT
jgi:hypothetical protein